MRTDVNPLRLRFRAIQREIGALERGNARTRFAVGSAVGSALQRLSESDRPNLHHRRDGR